MKTFEIDLCQLREAPWNSNQMDPGNLARLKKSIERYGFVQNLVVRPVENSLYEVLGGNQRLRILRELGISPVSCAVVDLSDTEAMLLAQALNDLRGEDDLAIKGSLLKKILAAIPQDKVLSILPQTAQSLQALSSVGQEDMAQHLLAWEKAQAARLSHMQLQFTRPQLNLVQEAVKLIMPQAKDIRLENPNDRANAIFLLCKYYLERRKTE